MPLLSEQLREFIKSTDKTQIAISHGCRLNPSGLCQFLKGRGGLSQEGIDRVAEYFGLTLVRHRDSKTNDQF